MTAPQPLTGLASAEAAERLQRVGPNRLPEPSSPGLVAIFVQQFRSPFIYILFAASAVSFGLGQTVNAYFIFAVLLLNACIGTFQEFSAERAAAALRNLVPSFTTVLRDGRPQKIDAADVVPDDIVELVSGDRVPADLDVLSALDLEVDESMLTGESLPVHKRAPGGGDADAAARCFAGTLIKRGRVTGRVTATGLDTEIGRIADQVVDQETVKPPLRQRIERFTVLVSWAMLVLVTVIFLITVARGDDLATV
ncbi:MAG: HAD-IC family P-type ATPase, partial [Gammaproteobacteria bacterium]